VLVLALVLQVLNLFLALLLSSFGAESLKHSQEDEGPNKLQEAVDRITRFCIYVKSHIAYCIKVSLSALSLSHHHQYHCVAWCRGVVFKTFDVTLRCRGFDSRSFRCDVATLGKLFTHMRLFHQALYNLVLVTGSDAVRLGR